MEPVNSLHGNYLARNIKRLRESRHLTQEQLANVLGLSFQAVSKWETGVTMPDIMLLPVIASYFGVAIDDLFKASVPVYRNEAEKLLARFASTHAQQDFLQAEAEFNYLAKDGPLSPADKRNLAILHEHAMEACRDRALALYDEILATGCKDALYYRVARQKTTLLHHLGRAGEAVTEWESFCRQENATLPDFICLVHACYLAGAYQQGLTAVQHALPLCETTGPQEDAALLHTLRGDIQKMLGLYDDAFLSWEKAFSLSGETIDPLFSAGFCAQELGRYEKAAAIWRTIVAWLTERGYTEELAQAQQLLRSAEHQLKQA